MTNAEIIKDLKHLDYYCRAAYFDTEIITFEIISNKILEIVEKLQSESVDEIENLILCKDVYELFLSRRILNALKCNNIKTIKELINHSRSQLLKIPNLGKVSLNEIQSALADHGLKLSRVSNYY